MDETGTGLRQKIEFIKKIPNKNPTQDRRA